MRVVASWEEFLALVGEPPVSEWAFRGHRSAEWPLTTALARYCAGFGLVRGGWKRCEERALRVFKRKASHYLQHVPPPDDDFQWLALMQHHGAPTRLLDFTWSPYVAAFFALECARTAAAVWAIRPPRSITPLDGRSFQLAEVQRSGRIAGGGVGIGEPYVLPRRLIAQSGTLVVPARLDAPIDELLDDPTRDVLKLVLPADRVRATGMRELYRMNVTNASLFPGLDGLARSLAYELEFAW